MAAGIKVNDAGYLPYAILDSWQQLKQDFAYWRVLNAAEGRETDMARRAWYREDRLRREAPAGVVVADVMGAHRAVVDLIVARVQALTA